MWKFLERVTAATSLCAVLVSSPCIAQEREEGSDELEAEPSLRARLTHAEQQAALEGTPEQQLAALQYLTHLEPKVAVLRLSGWLQSDFALTGAHGLAAIRTLARLTPLDEVQLLLFRILVTPATNAPAQVSMRRMAALALARESSSGTLTRLAQALQRGGDAAAFTREALLSFPPSDISPLFATEPLSLDLIRALDELGDQRAFNHLRNAVRQGTSELRAAAALALLHHGHSEVVEWAHKMLQRSSLSPELLAACCEILLTADPEDAKPAFGRLLSAQPEQAIALALRFPKLTAGIVRNALPSLNAALRPNAECMLELAKADARAVKVAASGQSSAPGSLAERAAAGELAALKQLVELRGDETDLRKALLGASNDKQRAAAYLGLALHPTPKVSGVLVRGYYADAAIEVRQAVLVALSHHPKQNYPEELLLDAQIDPDSDTRAIAHLLRVGGVPSGFAVEMVQQWQPAAATPARRSQMPCTASPIARVSTAVAPARPTQ